jgi:photosystem II stability/assembly factor-like uncharacterized protein
MNRFLTTLLASVILIGLGFIFPIQGYAQWVSTNGPYGGIVNSFVVSENTLFVGTRKGIYSTTNDGENWIKASKGLPNGYVDVILFSNDSYIFAFSTYGGGGQFRSSDNGENWEIVYSEELKDEATADIAFVDEYLFVATTQGIFRTTDNGENWEKVLTESGFFDLGVSGSNIFAGHFNKKGVIRSTDYGESWSAVENGLDDTLSVKWFETNGQNIYVGTKSGIFGSTDGGENWTEMFTGLKNLSILSIAFIGEKLYAGTFGDGVFVSTDNGLNWTQTVLTGFNVNSFAVLGSKIFIGTLGNGVLVSSDKGANWEQTTLNSEDASISSFTSNDEYIYTSIQMISASILYGAGVFRSKKDNIKWEPIYSLKIGTKNISCLETSGDNIYMGLYDRRGIYRSTDKGKTWVIVGSNYTGLWMWHISSIKKIGHKLFAGSFRDAVFVSDDNGDTWTQSGLSGSRVLSIDKINNLIFAGTRDFGIFISSDDGENWLQSNNGLVNLIVGSVCSIGDDLFAGTRDGVYRSTDNGNNWFPVNKGLTNLDIAKLLSYENYIFAATNGNGVFISSDSGENWKSLGTELSNAKVVSLYISGSTLLAGTEGFGVWSFDLNKITSVEDNLSADDLTVYPSPASDYIDISNLTNSTEIQIRNIFGERVMSVANTLAPTQRIDISTLPSGIYFIQYGKISQKFVVYR